LAIGVEVRQGLLEDRASEAGGMGWIIQAFEPGKRIRKVGFSHQSRGTLDAMEHKTLRFAVEVVARQSIEVFLQFLDQ